MRAPDGRMDGPRAMEGSREREEEEVTRGRGGRGARRESERGLAPSGDVSDGGNDADRSATLREKFRKKKINSNALSDSVV